MKNALINYRTAIFLAIIILGISLIFIGIGSSKNPEKFIIGNAVSALQKEAPASGISRPAESNVIDVASGNEVQDDVPPVQSIVTSHSSSRVETNKGKIEFEGAVDVSENDLDKYVKIEDNFISVDSEALPSLNKPATLTLYGNYDHTPVVLRDGKFCPECQVLDYSNGRVVFTVPHFSSYSLENCMKTDEQYRVNLSNNYFTLNYPGNYLICDDYNVTDAENRGVIFINSSDVSVDCQGTQITGDYSGTGIILRQFPEYDAWAEKTANFTDLKPILENLGGFLDGITFIENATIKNCNFRNFQYGMNITAIKNSLIVNNTFDNASIFFAALNTVVENNEVKNSEFGIGIIGMGSAVVDNKLVNDKNGIFVAGFDNDVIGNDLSGNENGIISIFAEGTKIENNTVAGNSGKGISLVESVNNTVMGNTILNNNVGISMSGLFTEGPAYGNVIKDNIIEGNDKGIEASDETLVNLFRMGKPRTSYVITGNFILSNKMNNTANDISVKGDGFTGNQITGNMFLGGSVDISCTLNNIIDKTNTYAAGAVYCPLNETVVMGTEGAGGSNCTVESETQITNDTADQELPSIYGDKIVWQDYRTGDPHIYMYDLSTSTETQITTNTTVQGNPAIYENKIVWQDYKNGDYNINIYDLSTSTETQITTNIPLQINPAIYKDKIVWQDHRNGNWDVYMYDLSTSTETQITNNDKEQTVPAIYEDTIVWEDSRYTSDIYMYNLSASTETKITNNSRGEGVPVIYKNIIVWSDHRNQDIDIYTYNLLNSTEAKITAHKSGLGDPWIINYYPAIYENKIVWDEYRNGSDNFDIYMYDLSTSTETQITTNTANQYHPVIYENKIVWQDDRNGNLDIYMGTLSPDCFAQNTTNCTPNWLPESNSCAGSQKLISYYDSNYCGITESLPADNGTYASCSSNSSVIGNINTTIPDFRIEINGDENLSPVFSGILTVGFLHGSQLITQFDFNFTNNVLDLSNVSVGRQNATATMGYVYVSGIELPEGVTKTLYMDKVINTDRICIKDSDIRDISEISNSCNGISETSIKCNGLERNGYTCTSNGTQYIITGLRHSGATQFNETEGNTTFAWLKFSGGNETGYDRISPVFAGARMSLDQPSCEGVACDKKLLKKGIFNFDITNGTSTLANMTLDGFFFATTTANQTFGGTALLWGNATINSLDPSFSPNGDYKIVIEYWNPSYTAFAVLDGLNRNIMQFGVDMTKVLQNEIIINGAKNVSLADVEQGTHSDWMVNGWGSISLDADYETLDNDLGPNYLDVSNQSLFIGTFNTANGTNSWAINGWGKRWYNNTEGKYHQVVYGYVSDTLAMTQECIIDSDCNDNNSATVDRCVDDVVGKICANQIPTIYGTAVDAVTGEPLAGEQVSVYSAEERDAAFEKCLNYDANGTEIGNCSLQPKDIPDAITDENGHYAIVGPPGVYHVVVNGSREDTLNRYVGNEVDHIYLPKDGTVKIVVEPERIEAGFHSSAYVKDNGVITKVFNDSHVTQTPVYVNVTKTGNLEFFINVGATDPYTFKYNLSTIEGNNHVTCYNNKYNLTGTNSSNQVIIDQLDGDTWRLWFEDLPPGHHWRVENAPKEPDYDDVVFLIDYTPAGENISNTSNSTNQTDYDCDNDGIPNYLDSDDDWCDFGDKKTEIVNESAGELYTAGQMIYTGRYRNKDQYMKNETAQFMIFGTNNMSENAIVTYVIEDHSHNPFKNVNGSIIYRGNISLEDERVTIYNDGNVWNSSFNFTIPADAFEKIDFDGDRDYNDYYQIDDAGPYSETAKGYDLNQDGDLNDNYSISLTPTDYFDSDGRYDVHIWYNGTKTHKLGDFYVIPDKAPTLNALGQVIYTNETAILNFGADDPTAYQEGMFYIMWEDGIAVKNNVTVVVTSILKLNESDNKSNAYESNSSVGSTYINITGGIFMINFTESGYYNITFTATNMRGRSTNKTVSVTVWITEDEAGNFTDKMFRDLNYGGYGGLIPPDWGDPWVNVYATTHSVTSTWDRYDDLGRQFGMEYMSKWDGLADFEESLLIAYINSFPGTGPAIIPIRPSTAYEFNNTLYNQLKFLRCDKGATEPLPTAPSCS